MEERFQMSNDEWSDHDFCLFINTRVATLLKQIIATSIIEECDYYIDVVRERLLAFGESFDHEQEEILSLLEKLTEPIRDEGLEAVVDDVITIAKGNLQDIQRLCWTGNPELAKDVQEATKSTINKKEGMRALIIGLVHEVVSLFGVELKHLIVYAQQNLSATINETMSEALEKVLELCNLVETSKTNFEVEERHRVMQYYSSDIVSQIDFARFFPFQPRKEMEYKEMKVTIKALKDLLHSHDQLIHVYAVKEVQLAEARCKLKQEEVDLAQAKVDMDYERATKSMEIFNIQKEMLRLTENDKQFRLEKVKVIQEMTRKKKELEKEYANLAAKHSELERKVQKLVQEKIEADGTIDRLQSQRDHFKMKYEALKLDMVKKEVDDLVQESVAIVENFQQQRIANHEPADKRYENLTMNIAKIGRIIAEMGSEPDTYNFLLTQHPSEETTKDC